MLETTNVEINMRTKKQILAAANYRGKPGRPPKITEPSTARNIRIPDRIWDKLPEVKSESVRKILNDYVKRIK